MAKKDNKKYDSDEELITSSGSGIAQVDDSQRGRRGATNNSSEEELITSSGSGIAQVDAEQRGRRGVTSNSSEEELITSSGSGITQVDAGQRGRKGIQNDTTKEERITSSGSGIAQTDASQRGRRGINGKVPKEEKITSSGSGIAGIERPRGKDALTNKNKKIKRTVGNLPSSFVLRGKEYKTIKLISSSTAEARVILVERDNKKYALKLYYSNIGHGPDPEVLRMIKNSDAKYLIKIYDFGSWVNPDDPNEECDYEIMQYCEGGPLIPGSFHGDNVGIIEVVSSMLHSAFECEQVGFIHRDIKPENFLWLDKEHTELVLSDFGFAVPCPEGESVRVEDHRTKIYTAPEFYLRAPGFPAKVGHESDIYSVGLSMLTLWSGEEVMMGLTETDLIGKKSQDKLPYPDDMDSDILLLLKGLTRGRPDERWDDAAVLRWTKGELDEQDSQFDNTGEIEITFDSSKGLIAHSRSDLADLMIRNQTLAKKYLYSGRIVRWLEDADLNDVAVEVERIVEEVYPKNQEAGLWSVIYLLSPTESYFFPGYDFEKIDDEEYDDDKEVAWLDDLGVLIWNNVFVNHDKAFTDSLLKELSTSDSNLAIFLEKEGRKDLIDKIKTQYIGDRSSYQKTSLVIKMLDGVRAGLKSNVEAICMLMYSVKPDLPWIFYHDSEETNVVESIEELIDTMNESGGAPTTLKYEAFVEWLLPRDPVLAAKVKNIQSETKPYKYFGKEIEEEDIAYALSPYLDYVYNNNPDDEDRVFTPEQLEDALNQNIFFDIDNFLKESDSLDIIGMGEFDHTAISYLRSKGKYEDLIEWIESCFPEEEYHEDKYGPYDARYAAFKILKGVGGHAPFYEFPDGKRISSLEEMRQVNKNVLKDALNKGALAPWIATFYQEDPFTDLKPQFAYETLTVKFLEEIGDIDPLYPDYVKYKNAKKKIDREVRRAASGRSGSRFTKMFMLPFLCLLFVLVAVLTIVEGIPDFNPVEGHYVASAITLSVIAVLVLLMGDVGFFASLVGGLIAGFLLALLFSWGLDFIAPWLTWIYLAIVVGCGVLMFVQMKRFMKVPYLDPDAPDLNDPGFQFRELEALHYAYKNEDATLADDTPNGNFTIEHYSSRFSRAGKKQLGESIGWGAFFFGLAVVLFFGIYFLSPSLSGERSLSYAAMNPGAKIMGQYSGKVDGKDQGSLSLDSISGLRVDSAVMTIENHKITLQGDIKRKGSDKFLLTLMPVIGSDSLSPLFGEYSFDLNLKKDLCDGKFIPVNPDKNGEIMPRTISFSSGAASLSNSKPTTEKKSKKKSSNKRKASSTSTVEQDNTEEAVSSDQSKEVEQKTSEPVAEEENATGFWKDTM